MDLKDFDLIFLTGAHGTGKTILGTRIATELNYQHAPSPSRTIIGKYTCWKNWKELIKNRDLYSHIQNQIVELFDSWVNHLYNTSTVFDRYYIDFFAYCKFAGIDGSFALDKMCQFEQKRPKAVILYFNLEYSYADFTEDRIFIDSTIRELLNLTSLPWIELRRGEKLLVNGIELTI